jgi:hypothetical protein
VTTTHRRRRTLGSGLALGVVAAGLSLAPGVTPTPAASAATGGGTIVYVKDYNVWITDGDGSFQTQVTSGGTAADPWQSPTESDNGVVVAHHSGLIYRMNQRGEVFNVIDPPAIPDSLGNRLEGRDLTETAISPDGTKIAYTYFKFAFGEKRAVTAFTDATQLTNFEQWGLAFYDNPSWVTNSRVVLNPEYRTSPTKLYDLVGQGQYDWFRDDYYAGQTFKELADVEVSRDGQWTVASRGTAGDETVIAFHNDGDVQVSPSPWRPIGIRAFEIGVEEKNLREPTVAPDSSTFAWAEPTGIFRSSDMNFNDATRYDILVAAGGSDPSWSTAAIGQTPNVPKNIPDDPGTPKHFDLKKKPKLVGKARVGKVLKAKAGSWAPAPESFSYRWTRDGKAIKKATKPRYRLTKKDRGHKIAVKVTAKRSGWLPTVRKTKPVRVKR